jgi:hypothetical protein
MAINSSLEETEMRTRKRRTKEMKAKMMKTRITPQMPGLVFTL